MRTFRWSLCLAACCLGWPVHADIPEFETVVLDPQIGKVCYAVTAADVDGDGRLDAVAISEREAMWYQNPSWKKRTMIRDAVPKDHVCLAAHDIDGDGKVDFSLGAGWTKNGGTLHWLRRGATLDEPWQVNDIGAEPWTHRMRWADVLGSGKPQLIVSPLNATAGPGIRLLAFPVPADPVAGPWNPVVIDGTLNRAHNHWHLPRGKGAETTIVASQEGLTKLTRREEGGFRTQRLATGASGEKATQQGSGEIKSGRLGDRLLLAAIEPMHGNQVVAYLGNGDGGFDRVVLDDSFNQGHAIWCADLDGDGRDEIVAAHREPGQGESNVPGIYLYRAEEASAEEWTRHRLDAPMACEDIWCADFNGDGKIDILAGGRATHDVKLYLQR